MKLVSKAILPAGWAAMAGLLVTCLGCGGGSSNTAANTTPTATPASALVYTAPASSGYVLVKDPSSTTGHLVLDLQGPAGTQVKGVVFSLTADTSKAAFASAGGTDPYLLPGQALSLGTGTPLLKSALTGSTLQAALYQKGTTPAATLGTQAVLSVALNLQPGATTGTVALSSPTAQILDATGKVQTITVAVGSLTAE